MHWTGARRIQHRARVAAWGPGPCGDGGKCESGGYDTLGALPFLPSELRIRSGRHTHPAAWAASIQGPSSQRLAPYTHAAFSFSAERGEPECPFPRLHIAQRSRGVGQGRGFFPIPFLLGREASPVPLTWGRIRGGRARVSGEEGGGGSTWPRVAKNWERLRGKWKGNRWMAIVSSNPTPLEVPK